MGDGLEQLGMLQQRLFLAWKMLLPRRFRRLEQIGALRVSMDLKYYLETQVTLGSDVI